MSQTDKTDHQLLEKILQAIKRNESSSDKFVSIVFTEQEIASLKRVAAREMAWTSIGILAASYKQIITYLGFFIVSWLAFKGYIVEWISSINR